MTHESLHILVKSTATEYQQEIHQKSEHRHWVSYSCQGLNLMQTWNQW